MKTNFQKMGTKFELIKAMEFQLPKDMSQFDPLSMNKVTGASVNFPAAGTAHILQATD